MAKKVKYEFVCAKSMFIENLMKEMSIFENKCRDEGKNIIFRQIIDSKFPYGVIAYEEDEEMQNEQSGCGFVDF